MGIIEWLNTYNGVIIGIATVVLVGITSIYVYLTWRLLKVNNTPEIAISLRPHEVHVNAVMLCIENIGTGAARSLQFATNSSSLSALDIPLEKIGVLRNGVAFFEPGRKIEQLLVIVLGKEKLNELRKTALEITVMYKDSANHKHKRAFRLDFGEFEGFSQFDIDDIVDISMNDNLQLPYEEFKAALEEWDVLVRKFAKPDAKPLSDYAVSREGIYEDHL